MKKIINFIILLLIISVTSAQEAPKEILSKVKEKVEEVENYSVDVLVKVEVDFINIKDRKAKVTFTKPDKFDVKAEGFTLLPKKGMEMEYMDLINQPYTAILIKEEIINGVNTKLIKVIPDNSDGDIVLAELWIDPTTSIMYKMKTYSKSSGTYTVFFYFSNNPFDLPEKVVVEFEVKNNKLPAAFTGDIDALGNSDKKDKISKGKVIILYSNYEIK
jgi:hypothetical protein